MITELEVLDRTNNVLDLINQLPEKMRGDLKFECLFLREKLLARCADELGARRAFGFRAAKKAASLCKRTHDTSLW